MNANRVLPMIRQWIFRSCIMAAVMLSASVLAAEPIEGYAVYTHDPSTLIKQNSRYYYFMTGQDLKYHWSSDLVNWNDRGYVFPDGPPAWVTNTIPDFTGNFWAPDVAYFNGKYHVYYSASKWATIEAAIGLVTSPSLISPTWTDQGKVVQSALGAGNDTRDYNCIDPSILVDTDGTVWMTYGSYASGILVTQLNPSTGFRLNPGSVGTLVANNAAGGGWGSSIEGACTYKHGGYYYLFVNYGACCSGVDSTYNIRVGRSPSVTGPYYDKDSVDMRDAGGSMLLETSGRFIGPGHAGILNDNGTEWFSYHYYDGDENGAAKYSLQRVTWDTDEWPVLGDVSGPTPTLYQEIGGVLSMEAENGTLGSRWLTGADAGASNDAYIEVDPAYNHTGSAPEGTTAEYIAAYDFNISTSGNYKFWFRMYSNADSDDSFFWRIDDGNWILENDRYGIGSWFSKDNTQVDNLGTGIHVLEIAYREDGTRLDKFVIQLDSEPAPSGDGPPESDNCPPAAPAGLVATATGYSIGLDWDDNGESDLFGYNIYRGTTSSVSYTQIATGVSTSDYVDDTVANGVRYYYVVTAIDTSSGESYYSNEALAMFGGYLESGGILSMEAENGTLGSRWTTGANGGASNDAYIEVDPAYNNTGSTPKGTTAEYIAAYDFNISTSGNYRFWFRMYSNGVEDDSFFWRIDGGSWILENDRSGIGSWFSTDNTQVNSLSTGSHVLEITYRENGTRLDKFVIQLDSLTAPSGDGPPESSQSQEPTTCLQVQNLGYRLPADLNGDCQIGMVDLILLTDQWLSSSPAAVPPNYSPDLVADNEINLADFAAIADQWLICNDPAITDCIINW